MKIHFLAIAVFFSIWCNTNAQDLKSLRGSWTLGNATNVAPSRPNYPAHDIFVEAMNYSSGSNGVKRDIYKAFNKYLQAADDGHPIAQYKVGACYYYGSGTKKNSKKAFQYWSQASQADIAEAHYELGKMYYYGEKCKRNYDTALELFHKAEQADIPGAFYMLGLCYLYGNGVEQNTTTAIEYLEIAVKKGFRDAKYMLDKANKGEFEW